MSLLCNTIVSNDLIGRSGFWNETSLHHECGLGFPDRLSNGGSHFEEERAGYETTWRCLA